MYRVFVLGLFLCYFAEGSPAVGDLDSLVDQLNKGEDPFNKGESPRPITSNLTPVDTGEVITCVTDIGTNGECVQYYLCTDNNTINTDGASIIDIRREALIEKLKALINTSDDIKYEKVMGQCSYLETCCEPKNDHSHVTPIPPIGVPHTHEPTRYPPVTQNPVTPYPPVTQHPQVVEPPETHEFLECGVRNPNGVGFRIKGDSDNEAQFGEFPWMVALLKEQVIIDKNNKEKKLNVYQCGGSLIHPKVVLTAAHCVVNSSNGIIKLKARVGEWDTQTKKEILPHQDREVVKVVRHKNYYAGGLFNDIAVLFLDHPIDPAENIGIVCLPPARSKAPTAKCFASGWGKDVFGKEGSYQVILKKVELPTVEHSKCQAALRKTRLGHRFELNKSFMCAGGEVGKDTCKGDGGSPLVCPLPDHPDRYVQSGIVAWGIGCGENGVPGVYADVAYLREWIDEQLIYNSIDMKPFEL